MTLAASVLPTPASPSMKSGFCSWRARKIDVARARSPMYRRSRRRSSTSSIDRGAATAKGYRLRFGNLRSIVCGVVRRRAIAVAAAEVGPRAAGDRAALGHRLVVRHVVLNRDRARAEDLVVGGIRQVECDARWRGGPLDATKVLDLGGQGAWSPAPAVLDGNDRVQRRPGGRVVEVDHLGRRLDRKVSVVALDRDVRLRHPLDRLTGHRLQKDKSVR